MAIVLLFPDRPAGRALARTEDHTAEVVILPCIRREPMGVAQRVRNGVPEQLQA